MNKFIFSLSLLLISLSANSQTWEKLFSGLSTDVIRSVREVPAGGYVIAGYTANFTANDTDAYVARLDVNGDTMWTYKFNGTLSKKDLFYKIIPTADGGFALCGYTTSVTGTSDDAMFMKLNSGGTLQWVKYWGGNQKERAQDIIQTADGGYAIVGYTTSSPALYYDAFIIKTNSTGDTVFTRRFGQSNYDDANNVKEMPDGGFIMGGQSSNGAAGFDMYLVRVGPTGNFYWDARFGTPQTDNIESILINGSGFILAGNTNTAATGDDGYIVQTDTGGGVLWSKTYGGSLPDDFHRIESTSDGGYVATGTTSSTGPALPNMWMMKLNSAGDSMWSKTFGGANHDHGYSGQQTSDGGYIIAGHTGSFGFNYEEGYVVKTDGSGNVSNHLTYTTVLDILTPNATSCGSPNQQIKIVLRNFGNQTVANIPVTVNATGSATINQTFSASADTVTLTTTINTSSGGSFTISAFTNNNNDVYPARNGMSKTFNIGVTPAAPSGTGGSKCGPGSVPLSASAPTTIYWYAAASGGAPLTTGTTYNTPSISTTTTYYIQTGTTCPSARIPVVATINPVSADPVTTNDSRCGNGTLTLTATASDPITWYDAASGGNVVGTGTSFTTPSLSSTTTYYAQASNGSCPSNMIAAVATVSSLATAPTTTSNQRCGAGAVVLTATSPDPIIWYDAATGGNQVHVGASFTTPSISNTTTYWAEADNGCVSSRVSATATVNPLAADPTSVTGGQNCGPGTVDLSATAGDPVSWFDVATGGSSLGTGFTFTTPPISSTTTFYAEANNGTCPSNRISVSAVILPLPVINLPSDTSGLNGVTLDAGPGYPSYVWDNGATTQSITVSASDTFCVTVTDVSSCSTTQCVAVDVIDGIPTIEGATFSVYPNPANEKIRLEFSSSISSAIITIENMNGQIVKQLTLEHSGSATIDVSSVARGLYLMKIMNRKEMVIQKILLD